MPEKRLVKIKEKLNLFATVFNYNYEKQKSSLSLLDRIKLLSSPTLFLEKLIEMKNQSTEKIILAYIEEVIVRDKGYTDMFSDLFENTKPDVQNELSNKEKKEIVERFLKNITDLSKIIQRHL